MESKSKALAQDNLGSTPVGATCVPCGLRQFTSVLPASILFGETRLADDHRDDEDSAHHVRISLDIYQDLIERLCDN